MMPLGIYLATWSLIVTCSSAIPNIHRHMSPDQLRSIFHVEDVDQVPHYEIVQLTHHFPETSHHHVRKRAIRTDGGGGQPQLLASMDKTESMHEGVRHVKKDLSKNAYFSTAKQSADKLNPNSDKPSANNNKFNKLNSAAGVGVVADEAVVVDGASVRDEGALPRQHNVSLTAFGEQLHLKLQPTEGLFKNGGPHTLRMWTVKPNPNASQGLDYEEVIEEEASGSEAIGQIYQDEKNMAAILMRRQLETGDLMMEGSIGHDLVIRPIPADIIHPLNADGKTVQHVVFKRDTASADEQFSDFAFMEPDRLQKRFRQRRSTATATANLTDFDSDFMGTEQLQSRSRSRSKRQSPHIIYPEILVIVDYDGYRLHGGDNVQVKRYFVSFWNGVDLRYRLLKGPRIRISIAGIIISRGRDATPYLERNRVGRDAIDSAAALTDMGKYLFRERRLPVYDIAVAITKLDMCRRQYANDVCNRGTAGFAYVGGACVVNKRLEKVNSVAIIEDTGGFSGIIVAAHEVGHLLGAVHDGSPPPSYLGGPGAEKCRWEDGYIMSDLRHTERGFRWSACSIQSFHHFLNGDTATCLHNAPHEDEALGRALPGTLLSLDAQCRRDRGTSACFKDERVCAQLFCFDAASGYCVAYRPAAEGSTCGDGLHCLDGRCVAEHENIIPDYSQHTPSYAANPNPYGQYNTEPYSYYEEDAAATTVPPAATYAPAPSSSTTTYAPYTTRNYFNNLFYNSFQQIKTSSTTFDPFSIYLSTTTTQAPAVAHNPYNHPSTDPPPSYHHYGYYSTHEPSTSTERTTEKPSTKINPFYYGLYHNQHQQQSTTKAYDYQAYRAPSSTTTQSPVYRNNYYQQPQQNYQSQDGSVSTTRNPVFDLYLSRKASATKNPYDFYNFGIFNKATTESNYLGANSQINQRNLTSSSSRVAAIGHIEQWRS